ncbi:MAG: alkaline phosphatase family protein [Phycisphaerales bacterium]|nr:alkaline phosphatase family protein [Phycisphaerales bacterium]MCB9854815.1 alkaline phosphatase family protein [Phycisphaerales bacterium]MCB9863713.1 alkaline phosphatase family protein [Phycisphaerales bacterium]
MPSEFLFLISMPGLRRRDLEHMPRLRAVADKGAAADLVPTFPCVTSPVQASMLTGRPPAEHGIIGNGFYYRDCGEVELWVGRNNLVQCEQVWDALARRGVSQAAWIPQNIKDAAADFIVTPEPIHHDDGRTELWCYSKPDGLYADIIKDIDHFPLMNFWGPLANIKSTEWTINAALWLLQRERPRFNYIYVPHLDYEAQKFGPNSEQQAKACREADDQLGRLFDGVAALGITDADYLVVSEYAMTDVSRVIYPNRMLRDAGMAQIDERDGHEYLNLKESKAFAVVDHQFAHVYVNDPTDVDAAAGIFEGLDGIADSLYGDARSKVGMNHERAGEVVLVCEPDTWLAYYWWHDDAKAPPFAHSVDIHNKPGYDPVEMFIKMPERKTPIDATLVKGSHGAPAESADQYGAIIASDGAAFASDSKIRDVDIRSMIERMLE